MRARRPPCSEERVAQADEPDQEAVRAGLRRLAYFTTPRVETALFLALRLGKPLLAYLIEHLARSAGG